MQNKMEGKVESLQKEQIVQIGFLVKDIRKTAKKWAEFLGVEMPEISMTGKYEETHAVYRGEPCNGQIYQVCFDLANIQIEFIEPIGEEPSYWKECLDRDGEGLHHIAFRTESCEKDLADLESQGYPAVQQGEWKEEPKNGRYAYLDMQDSLKCIIELVGHVGE